jgi:HEAT repeat protein
MEIATSKLVRLLDAAQPVEVRSAAALVLGEIGVRDADVGAALCGALDDIEPTVRQQAIRAVGKLRVESALPALLERIKVGGVEAEEAARSAARLGAKGVRGLQDLMPKVAPGLRRYIGAALAAAGTGKTETAGVAVLLDRDPGVVEAAARSLLSQLPTLTAAQRQGLTDQLLELVGKKSAPLAPASEAAAVRLLAALEGPAVEAALWERVLPPHPPEVRATALQALGKWAGPPGKDHLRRLLTCAADSDFRVAAPALVLLKALPVQDRALPDWLPLLQAHDVAVRRLAIDKLGERDTPEVAAALLAQLDHPDWGLRDAALARLSRLEHGREALGQALREADSPDRAWALARSQAPFARNYPPQWREELFEEVCQYLEAGDRRADALLFLLREADAADLRDRLEQRALTLRKKKDYPAALHYLRLLARDPACGFPTRLELAACGLKVSARDLAAEARANDPCLQQFTNLCQNYEGELLQELEKAKWLEPEELFYLGFHFAEKGGQQKKFAEKILHLVLARSPRSKLAQAARSKLRSAGLDEKPARASASRGKDKA